ncbi:MAG TPA: DUF3619 family protein [Steroidobacteraceae bacterium]|nr:DUF3619 family protein [Steroidobacteraceae bacterium]
MNTPEDKNNGALEQRTRDVFDQQTASLDAHTLSRLNQARQAALNVVRKEKTAAMPRWLMPAGSVAALALVATMAFRFMPGTINSSGQALSPLEDMEIIASNEDIDLLQDVDFYDSLDNVDAGENGAG